MFAITTLTTAILTHFVKSIAIHVLSADSTLKLNQKIMAIAVSILLVLTRIAISTHLTPTSSTTATQSPPLTTTTVYQINQEHHDHHAVK